MAVVSTPCRAINVGLYEGPRNMQGICKYDCMEDVMGAVCQVQIAHWSVQGVSNCVSYHAMEPRAQSVQQIACRGIFALFSECRYMLSAEHSELWVPFQRHFDMCCRALAREQQSCYWSQEFSSSCLLRMACCTCGIFGRLEAVLHIQVEAQSLG